MPREKNSVPISRRGERKTLYKQEGFFYPRMGCILQKMKIYCKLLVSRCVNVIWPFDRIIRKGDDIMIQMRCNKCEIVSFGITDKFCYKCGELMQRHCVDSDALSRCQKCENPIFLWDKFCRNCGQPVPKKEDAHTHMPNPMMGGDY